MVHPGLAPDLITDPPQLEPEAERPRDIARRVFGYWAQRTGHTRALLTPDRASRILARLREGYSETDLRRAIDGCLSSAFHMGSNDTGQRYDDITLIFRSGSKLEQFRAMAGGAATTTGHTDSVASKDAEKARALSDARAALERGDVERHNAIVERLRSAR